MPIAIRTLAICLGILTGLMLATPVSAADVVVTRDSLIGRLIPITGDPIRSVDLRIAFALNSADIADTARPQLDELGAALTSDDLADLDVGIYGHTDASGDADANQALSEARAAAVAQYLVEGFGIEEERLDVRGFGETRLLDSQPPTSAEHRRVEIVTSRPVVDQPTPADQPAPAETPSSPPQGTLRAIN